MQLRLKAITAHLHCAFKSWQAARQPFINAAESFTNNNIILSAEKITPKDKLAISVWAMNNLPDVAAVQVSYGINAGKTFTIRLKQYASKAEKLLQEITAITGKNEPPAFYKNKHCPGCRFWESCYKKLIEKDCISLLAGMSPKVLSKYHGRGIFSITQLSHLFRPRRRGRQLASNKYLWELKALAIREQKTFVLQTPVLDQNSIKIFIDFEGLPDEGYIYLIGVLIQEQDKTNQSFSFWAGNKAEEEKIYFSLFDALKQYPDANIYHYGSYETKTLKKAYRKYTNTSPAAFTQLEKRMVNLLGYLRTHVYPPTYSNGLKELAAFLGFQWHDEDAGGLQSINWRKHWEGTKIAEWKDKLIRYNLDDCVALAKVYEWLQMLAGNGMQDTVQQVSQMKKYTPYKWQSNKEFGEDFQFISKAAYFDYQRNKIYWRNTKSKVKAAVTQANKPPSEGKGIMRWQPKKVNEVIVMPEAKSCKFCAHKKLYRFSKKTSVLQTDLKFTPSGIRQHVIEYQSGMHKCAKCQKTANDANLRIRHYGDNLFAYATYLYINFNISNELVSRLIQEQFGIWMSQMYLVMNKHKWWKLWDPEVAYIKQTVLKSPVVHIDETTIKLDNSKGYVWVFATAHSVFYHFTVNHEGEFLQELLKDYKGIIVTDFFPVYETLEVGRQKCLVHLVRDLNDDLFKNPFDEEYKNFVSAFSRLLKVIIETIDKFGLRKRNLSKHIKDTEKFSQQFIEVNYKSELATKYAKRLKKHWEQLWTFLHHDDVPWNNNNAEAAVKAFAMYRRGINGQVSQKGINWYLPMLSIAQTCRYRNISFLDFLRHKKGIWQNIHPESLPGFLPYRQARLYAHKQQFKNKTAWTVWAKGGKRPIFVPPDPEIIYKETGWVGWEDWLGLI